MSEPRSSRSTDNDSRVSLRTPVVRWEVAGRTEQLESDLVHVWCIRLRESCRTEERRFLSESELDRAARFHFDEDRRRFERRHASLRIILAAYLSCTPGELCFDVGAYGKPELTPPWKQSGLRFNVSDSDEIALLAVTRGSEVGVDVERERGVEGFEDLAARFFTGTERAQLAAVEEADRLAAFFRCWTRKEAVLKATGKGLSLGLDSFSVSVDAESAQLLSAESHLARGWHLTNLQPAIGYFGALATEFSPSCVRCFSFDG